MKIDYNTSPSNTSWISTRKAVGIIIGLLMVFVGIFAIPDENKLPIRGSVWCDINSGMAYNIDDGKYGMCYWRGVDIGNAKRYSFAGITIIYGGHSETFIRIFVSWLCPLVIGVLILIIVYISVVRTRRCEAARGNEK